MDPEKARDILRIGQQYENYDGPIPEDDADAIREGDTLVQQARNAWDSGYHGPDAEAVLRLADETFDGTRMPAIDGAGAQANGDGSDAPEVTPVAEAPDAPEEQVEPVEEPAPAVPQPGDVPDSIPADVAFQQPPWTSYDTDSWQQIREALDQAASGEWKDVGDLDLFFAHVHAYEHANKHRVRILRRVEQLTGQAPAEEPVPAEPQPVPAPAATAPPELPELPELDVSDLVAEVEHDLDQTRLHVPAPPTDDPPVLPEDFSRVSDGELRSLHARFGALTYHADYQVAKHERIAAACKQRADELSRELLLKVAHYDDHGKERRMSIIEAEVESIPQVRELRRVQRQHEIFAAAHRRERDSYHRLVEALSRQESMRHNEWQRAQR